VEIVSGDIQHLATGWWTCVTIVYNSLNFTPWLTTTTHCPTNSPPLLLITIIGHGQFLYKAFLE
jgi:hypothetical protein